MDCDNLAESNRLYCADCLQAKRIRHNHQRGGHGWPYYLFAAATNQVTPQPLDTDDYAVFAGANKTQRTAHD